MKKPEQLPEDGASFADDLDALFRSGGIGELSKLVDDELKMKIDEHLNSFVVVLNAQGFLDMDNPRNAAEFARGHFEMWKVSRVRTLRENRLDNEAEAIGRLSLKDVATFTKSQSERAMKELGPAIGTPQEEKLRKNSDFWCRMNDIIGPASDPDK